MTEIHTMRDLEYLEEQNRQLRESLKACKLEVNKLRTALRMLYDEMDEYQRINKLSAYNNQVMRQARAALEEK